jgi:ubiquinone/menaquinone biosynthesis C-methylase UbiE
MDETFLIDEQRALSRYYGGLAAEFARVPARIHAVPLRQTELQHCIADVARHATDRVVLELACGVGFWTRVLATNARWVIATDVLPDCVSIARRMVGGANVRFVAMDATQMASKGAGIDAVFAGFWLSHLHRQRFPAVCRELTRRLPAGTSVLFIENEYPERHLRPFETVSTDGDTYEVRSLRDGSKHLVLKNYWNDDELSHALKAHTTSLSVRRSAYYYSVSFSVA